MADDVDAVMQTIPEKWREYWCEARYNGGCACMGCVEVGNRLVMAGLKTSQCDPEYIDESKIPTDVFKKYKVTKAEWSAWKARRRS